MYDQYETHSNYYKDYGVLLSNNKTCFMNYCIVALIVNNLTKKI